MIDNFICQTVSEAGSNKTIFLSGAVTGFGKFSDAFSTNTVVYYTLIDGNNKETGVGNFNPSLQTLERIKVFTVVAGGVYRKNPVTYLNYSNTAIVASMNSIEALLANKVSWVKEPIQIQLFSTMGSLVKGFVVPTLTRKEDYVSGQCFLPQNIKIGSEVYIELLFKSKAATNNQISLITEYMYVTPNVALPTQVNKETTRYMFEEGGVNAAETVRIPLSQVTESNTSLVFNLKRAFEDGLDTVDSTLAILGARLCYQIDRMGHIELDNDAW